MFSREVPQMLRGEATRHRAALGEDGRRKWWSSLGGERLINGRVAFIWLLFVLSGYSRYGVPMTLGHIGRKDQFSVHACVQSDKGKAHWAAHTLTQPGRKSNHYCTRKGSERARKQRMSKGVYPSDKGGKQLEYMRRHRAWERPGTGVHALPLRINHRT